MERIVRVPVELEERRKVKGRNVVFTHWVGREREEERELEQAE